MQQIFDINEYYTVVNDDYRELTDDNINAGALAGLLSYFFYNDLYIDSGVYHPPSGYERYLAWNYTGVIDDIRLKLYDVASGLNCFKCRLVLIDKDLIINWDTKHDNNTFHALRQFSVGNRTYRARYTSGKAS